jgi:hypothetical protein
MENPDEFVIICSAEMAKILLNQSLQEMGRRVCHSLYLGLSENRAINYLNILCLIIVFAEQTHGHAVDGRHPPLDGI